MILIGSLLGMTGPKSHNLPAQSRDQPAAQTSYCHEGVDGGSGTHERHELQTTHRQLGCCSAMRLASYVLVVCLIAAATVRETDAVGRPCCRTRCMRRKRRCGRCTERERERDRPLSRLQVGEPVKLGRGVYFLLLFHEIFCEIACTAAIDTQKAVACASVRPDHTNSETLPIETAASTPSSALPTETGFLMVLESSEPIARLSIYLQPQYPAQHPLTSPPIIVPDPLYSTPVCPPILTSFVFSGSLFLSRTPRIVVSVLCKGCLYLSLIRGVV